MDSATTLSAPQGQGTTISQSEVDELWNQYQQAQKNPQKAPAATAEQSDGKTISAAELDKLYKDYTKQETLKLGNELRSDPDNEDKFNAYQNATERYYEARGGLGAIKEELTTDEETLKNVVRSGSNFLKQQWETAKKAAGARDPFEIWEATKKGSIAGAADFPVLLAQAISLGSEKLGAAFQDIKTEKKDFSGAARTAAERLRDTARYERMIEESFPKDEANRAVAQLSRFGTGIFLPVGGAAAATKTGKALEAVEGAKQVTKQAGKATQAAEQAGKLADISAGAVEGGIAGGITGGVRGAVTGALKGGFKETALGKGIAEAAGKAKEVVGETIKGGVTGGVLGGVLGAGITSATEPTGTPVSTGAAPGAVLGAGIGAVGGARGAIRGEAAGEAAAPARDPYRDFDRGGAVQIDQNRWAMETGFGVGEQSQKFGGPVRETLHRDTLSSHQNMQPNPRHGVSDSVIRYGYDPETRTLQVVMSESTKGDYVPRDRYVYQNVSPELAQRIMNSPSIQAELNAIANEGGSGIRMSRPVITDKQLNSLINDINSGKLDFHPEWGLSKGSGTPPEFQFRAPETAKAEPTSSSFDDFETKDWNPAFFESIGRKAGKAYRGARESVRDFFNPQREAAESEKVSDADIARFRRESRSRGTPVEEPQKALGAAPERRALAAAAPLPEPQPVLGTTEVRRPMLQEPTERVQRREDVEAAFAEEDARLAREEQIRQSPLGAEALRGTLKKRAQDAERRQRYKEEGRVPLASYRKKAGVEFPPSEEALRQANIEATPAPKIKEPDVPFEQAVITPPGKTSRDAKRMSQRMREIDAELPVATPKKRVELLNERLQIAAELGNEKAAEYLLGGKADEDKKLAVFHQKVRKLINEQGITNDPTYENAGEVKALRESGINFKNFNARGKTLDKLGEEIQRLATEAGRMTETAETTLGVSDVTNFIQEAFNAPRNVEPPRIGEPPIQGRAVKIKEPPPKKTKAESEEVTSIKDLRAQNKKAAIAQELAGKFAEPAPKGGKKVTLEQPAEKPAPAKTSTPPSKPTTKSYEDEIYRISQVVPPGPVSPKVVGMIADGVVKKGLLTADEVTDVRKISDLNKLLQDKIDAKKETGSKQYWSAESLNLESMKTSPSERAGAAPYTLIVDGKTKRYWSLSALDKVLKSISSEKPRIFKNADKGITINFDS